MSPIQSAERVSRDASDNFVFQRSLLAYSKAAGMIGGRVLEIGTGSGYGVSVLSASASEFITVDKFDCGLDFSQYPNVEFRRMNVPPLSGIETGSMDFVVSFQVIEHIRKDRELVAEVYRVLKAGGRFIVSTPNKAMSLTRNPWHVREYTAREFYELLSEQFAGVQAYGVFGRDNVMEYYEANRRSVRKITRFDIFNLQYRLPCRLLQIPYDILNRINRRRLLAGNTELTSGIKMGDYYLDKVADGCFDLFYVAEKKG